MSLYVDKNAIMNVIGCIFKNSNLLSEEQYKFTEEDFNEQIPKIIYGTLNNLYIDGIKKFDLIILDNYLSKFQGIYNTFKTSGIDYLKHCIDISKLENFDYYFERMKKFTLLRLMDNYGINMKWFYDPTIPVLSIDKVEAQEERLNNTSLVDISILIDKHIDEIKVNCITDNEKFGIEAKEGLRELLENLKETPDVGIPMYGKFINTITRGARLGKFYLRSAPVNCGKTRTMIADFCNFACNELFNKNTMQWERNGTAEPSLFISTEQELKEVQTMIVSFIADVEEDKILTSNATFDELARIERAIQIIEKSPLYIVTCPDFSLQDIENIIKINIKKYDIKYICLDYIHTSMKILEEITRRSGGVKLREDNILFMLSVALKDICNKYQVFILSSTQLNGDWINQKEVNQNLLRGAKSIADKIDIGSIIMPLRDFELVEIEPICKKLGYSVPNIGLHFYKNRANKYKNIIIWCKNELDTCKIKPIFVTDSNYKLIDVKDTEIEVVNKED